MDATDIADDLLPNTRSIAAWLGIPPARVARLCRDGELPTFRIGKHHAARKSTLLKSIEAQEGATRAVSGAR
jgi:hypothetical protein